VDAVATPLAFVVAVVTFVPFANVPPAPVLGAVNVTVAPLTRFPPLSFTVACRAVGNAVLIAMLCGVPAVAVTLAGGPARLVSENAAGVPTPLTLAFTVYVPTVEFAVKAAVATPLALVDTCSVVTPPVNVPLAPVVGAVNVTGTPLNKFPPLSFTVACRLIVKGVLMAMLCGVPAVGVIEAGAPVRFVRTKLTAESVPATAVTLYGPPAVPLAVKVGAVAIPLELVVAVAVSPPFVPPAKVPLGPLEGALKVTITPLNGSELLSFTVVWRDAKAVLIATLCGVPLVVVIDAGVPVRFVRVKLAAVATPETVAATL
jgi:hypothetical protein